MKRVYDENDQDILRALKGKNIKCELDVAGKKPGIYILSSKDRKVAEHEIKLIELERKGIKVRRKLSPFPSKSDVVWLVIVAICATGAVYIQTL